MIATLLHVKEACQRQMQECVFYLSGDGLGVGERFTPFGIFCFLIVTAVF